MSNGQSNGQHLSAQEEARAASENVRAPCEKNTFIWHRQTSVRANAGVHVTHDDWLTLWLSTFPPLFIPLVDLGVVLNAISGTGLICQVSLDWFTPRVWTSGLICCLRPSCSRMLLCYFYHKAGQNRMVAPLLLCPVALKALRDSGCSDAQRLITWRLSDTNVAEWKRDRSPVELREWHCSEFGAKYSGTPVISVASVANMGKIQTSISFTAGR